MLAFLLRAATSAPDIQIVEPANKDACFGIVYKTSSRTTYNLTLNNQGFFVGYRVYNDNNEPSDVKLLKWSENNVSTLGDITVNFTFSSQKQDVFYMLNFTVTNKGYFPAKIDLGVFGDTSFGDTDDAIIEKKPGGQGLNLLSTKKGTNSNTTFQLENDGYYPPISTLFTGNMKNEETSNPTKLPFFKNESVLRTTGDSVFAFAWQGQTISPNEKVHLGFMAYQGSNKQIDGRIVDKTEKKEFYSPNDNVTIKFRVYDYNANENYLIYLETGRNTTLSKTNFTFTTSADKYYQDFEYTTTVGEEPLFRYTISGKKMVLKAIRGYFIVSSQPPLTVTKPPSDTYKNGDKIYVQLTATNATKYKYTFGQNGRVDEMQKEGDNFMIAFPDQLLKGKKYTLSIWVENQYGVKSEIKQFDVTYGELSDNNANIGGVTPTPRPNKVNVLAIVLPIVFAVLIIIGVIVAVFIYNKKKNSAPQTDVEAPVTDGGATKYENFN